MEIFAFFNGGLSKSAMATMADSITSTDDLVPYVLDRLFDSFSYKFLSDVDDQNNNDVDKLGKMDADSESTFDGYSDVSDDECDGVNVEDELHIVLLMLDDA